MRSTTTALLTSLGLLAALGPMAVNAATPAPSATPPSTVAAAGPAAPQAAAPARSEAPVTRDWGRVDTNKDHLVSPEEMSVFLKNNPGPLSPHYRPQ